MADLVERIQQAMEATTKGKWCQFHPSYADEAKGTPSSEWDSSHDMSAFKDGHRSRIASFRHADDAAYVDAVSPENISALLSELLRLREENARIRQIISGSAAALPNGAFISPSCSVEFMEGLPKEIALVCAEKARLYDLSIELNGLAVTAEICRDRIRRETIEEAAKAVDAKAALYEDDAADQRETEAIRNLCKAIAVRLRGSAADTRDLRAEGESR